MHPNYNFPCVVNEKKKFMTNYFPKPTQSTTFDPIFNAAGMRHLSGTNFFEICPFDTNFLTFLGMWHEHFGSEAGITKILSFLVKLHQ